ncbi:leucine-rich repeat-containing protein 45-like [Watersipora subatra]|uniref:leucine-rich repeat-containing protein 45-like n=1 Tax=Watersipora subatra TaxID=2589382 RepID=UPI00355B784F
MKEASGITHSKTLHYLRLPCIPHVDGFIVRTSTGLKLDELVYRQRLMAAEFYQEYIALCKERNIEPHDGLLKSLKRPCVAVGVNGHATLNLRTTGLDEQTCGLLGKLLSVDRLFEQIDLGDCALSDGAVCNILCGLTTNVACRKLNLKGNNIRGKSVESLGHLLGQNRTIESLSLEWNNVGMLEEPFMVFCEGVGGSTSLITLDLRNNQISHQGAGELATALKRNTVLKLLDLRWNNVGLIGGRKLLEAFKFNKTLDQIDLNGNDVPGELKKAIENAARGNMEIHKLSDEFQRRTQTLAGELAKTQQDHVRHCDHLMNRLDEKDDRLRKTNRYATQKVEHFRELLEERKSAFNTVTSKLARTESELLLVEQKAKDFEILLEKERLDKETLGSSYRAELSSAQQQHGILEMRLSAQLADLTEKHNDATVEVIELRKKAETQAREILDLKELLANREADFKLAAASGQERLRKEQHKHSQSIREMEQLREKEIERLHADQSLIEKSLREHIAKVEEQRRDREEEISKMKALMVSERIKGEEELSQTRQKLKSDQEFHIQHMEDKLRLIHSAKDEVQQMNSQQACAISELQTKNSSLSMSVDNLKRQIDSLQQGIASKHQDIEKAKQDVQDKMGEKVKDAEKEIKTLKSAREKLQKMEQQQEERLCQLELNVDKKNEEIKHLKEKIAMREADIVWMREETTQRAHALQTAVRNYAQPFSTPSN